MKKKILLANAERAVCQTLGVPAYRRLRSLLQPSRSEFNELAILRDLLLPRTRQGLMIDVGAHFGESFCLFAYSGWDVLAFEPDPAPLKHAMIQARSTRRVQLFTCALSDVAGREVPFYVSDESTGVSSLSPFLDSHKPIDRIVQTETLSGILDSAAISKPIDLLKIDTEGHDLFVLQGIDWTNPRHRPRAVLCEFEDRKTLPLGYSFRDLGNYLRQQHYDVFLSEWHPIERYGGNHHWRSIREYPCDMENEHGWGNFLAVDPELTPDLRKQLRTLLPS